MSKPATCPNCNSPVKGHPDNSCVLNALIGVLRERGVPAKKLEKLHAACWIDNVWDDIGPIMDRLEDGYYSAARPPSC